MTAIVFLGPSAPLSAARAAFGAEYRPPARQGDVWRALRDRPRAIGLIDGYFEQRPAVWHKEILEALSLGVHVFGAASMGALRAAELGRFGMRGVGRIWEAFAEGRFTDDDEVALAHGPAETGYVALSEPMANVRFTLDAALRAGVLEAREAEAVAAAAKAIFHADRTWAAIDRRAAETGVAADRLAALALWRRDGAVDQKRLDALAMLTAMRDFLAEDPPPFAPAFRYVRTSLAEAARRIALDTGREDRAPDDRALEDRK
jgi:hypothetical protein